jgi:catechol 2,3-dioxygenase-like lactoylglutathione lyase family enzyme
MKLVRIVLFCEDLARSTEFYKSLQLPIVEEREGFIVFNAGHSHIALHQGKNRKPRFEYLVDDLEAVCAQFIGSRLNPGEVKALGANSYFDIKDRDGNTLRVLSA